jgi:hypothetical protein
MRDGKKIYKKQDEKIISPAFLPLAFCPVFELFLGSFEPENVQLHINILDSKKRMKIQNNEHLKKKKNNQRRTYDCIHCL